MTTNRAGWRQTFSWTALVVSILAVVFFAVAALGSKFGLWGWQFGLGTMIFNWGPKIAMGALLLSVLALIIAVIKAPRKQPLMLAAGALLVSGLLMGRLAGIGAAVESLPPIHDIQTDWNNPIMPSSKLLDARTATGAMNPVEANPVITLPSEAYRARWPGFDGQSVASAQEAAEFVADSGEKPKDKPYGAIGPIETSAAPAAAFASVEALVAKRGWTVVTADAATGMLEATYTSTWFGFHDDVLFRVIPTESGSRIDIRSVSRVGLSDLGANAKRVVDLLRDLRQDLPNP